MKQATQKKLKSDKKPLAVHMQHRIREGLFICSIAVSLFFLISFCTFHATDPGWSVTGAHHTVLNWGGRVGAFLADVLLSILGVMAYVFPPMMVFAAWVGTQSEEEVNYPVSEWVLKSLGFIFILFSGCGLVDLMTTHRFGILPAGLGGILGDLIGSGLTHVFNINGSFLVLIAMFLCGVTLFTGFSWVSLIDRIGFYVTHLFQQWRQRKSETTLPALEPSFDEIKPSIVKSVAEKTEKPAIVSKPKVSERIVHEPVQHRLPIKQIMESSVVLAKGTVPPLTLLNAVPIQEEGKTFSNATLEELSHLVEQRLSDFGVEVKVVAVHPGPVITRFELDLAPGVKVSKISGLAKDIARSLSVTSVRIVEVIPGKSVIGLELPNEHREVVCLREMLESQRYQQSKSPVSLALGKDIAGYPVVVDLAKMPHLLAAGTTGSGKSVSLNAMLLSMLFKSTPEQLRLILIDPKMLELSIYEGIPHLLTPVITDMKDAANALRWCVAEMDRRYKLMASMGVRNLAGFNQKVTDAIQQKQPLQGPAWMVDEQGQPINLEPLPMIVVVADELADMMMVVGKKVEDLVTRIAQKARAAGIHLMLATQRPSVDVITGLIKANIPTRIAFQVSSRIDSRTILDQQGAEQLLGHGDMLYLPPGAGVPVRVHGAYVADEEVHRVVAAWQTYGKPVYLDEVTEGGETGEGVGEGGNGSGGEADPLYDQALRIVTETRRASISLVQRKLKIGYNRAATIMESLEAAGVVTSMDHSGSREVLAPPPVEV